LLSLTYIPPKNEEHTSKKSQSSFVIDKPGLKPNELRSEVNGMLSVAADTDAVLAAVQNSLKKLLTAHKELVNATNADNSSVDVAVQQFVKEASSIKDYYQKLLTTLNKSGA
jgi:hypothetical protein